MSGDAKSQRPDMTMLALVLLLVVFGLVILFSTSEYNGRVRFHDSAYYFKKQLFATALGLAAMYAVSRMDYRFLRPWHLRHICFLCCFRQQFFCSVRRLTVLSVG